MVAFLQKNAGQKFKARDIARWVFETYPEDCRAKQKRSTAKVTPLDSDAALVQQLVAEIGSQWPQTQKRFPAIKATAGRPRYYYYAVCSDAEEVEQAENPPPPTKASVPSMARNTDLAPGTKTQSEH
ncbi:MAG: HrgA protein, partial [Flavobacteriia bacterium]|nr:HrgA protein [Flavobacteriia bacterium]